MTLKCDCGNDVFLKFGPYPVGGDEDTGLRLIYTCNKCGDQLRIYQASKMLRGMQAAESLKLAIVDAPVEIPIFPPKPGPANSR